MLELISAPLRSASMSQLLGVPGMCLYRVGIVINLLTDPFIQTDVFGHPLSWNQCPVYGYNGLAKFQEA